MRGTLPGHTLLPKPKTKLSASLVNIPSASKNLSGMNCSALGYRVSSRDIALRKLSIHAQTVKGRRLHTKGLQRQSPLLNVIMSRSREYI